MSSIVRLARIDRTAPTTAHECNAQARLGVGGNELAAAERAGRELTKLVPYRELAIDT